MTPAQRGARTRKQNALMDAYCLRFPDPWSGFVTSAVQRAMRAALKTGIDHPLMIEIRKENARSAAEYDAKLAAEHAQPFTPDLEKHYTGLIKRRELIEGDCERPWQNYFDYRAGHVKEVEPLNAIDLAYANIYTPRVTAIVPSTTGEHVAITGGGATSATEFQSAKLR
jgi:hypothetical protein